MKRIASIWLPHLAIERWAKTADCPPDKPVVLTAEGAHGPIIHAVTNAAAERGASCGARLTDARALDPALIAVAADIEGDAALVRRLAKWASRWSPLVEVDGSDALRLDISGVAHLFGGEEGLVCDIEQRFAAMAITARVAIAPTAAAAWALSHFGRSIAIVPKFSSTGTQGPKTQRGYKSTNISACSESLHESDLGSRFDLDGHLRSRGNDQWAKALAPLHVVALRLDADTVRTLERLGLKTIGALIGIPRLALARRFRGAEDVVDALDRMFGRKPEALTAAAVDPAPQALVNLEEPAIHPGAASEALEILIPEMVRLLQERHLGARRLSLTGFRVDGSIAVASVATSISSRDPKHFHRLLADKVAALDPEFGFDAFALQADWSEDLSAAQDSLTDESTGEHELARLVDRLTVKLGPKRVQRPKPFESHLPERASGWVGAIANKPLPRPRERPIPVQVGIGARASGVRVGYEASPNSHVARVGPLLRSDEGFDVRPQRLLDRPEAIEVIYASPEGMPRRFIWRRAVHDIARAEGPERIAPEWWRQPSNARLRDYYRVEDSTGRRYWIYREGLIGDGRGGAPNWFIHGLFG